MTGARIEQGLALYLSRGLSHDWGKPRAGIRHYTWAWLEQRLDNMTKQWALS